MALDPDEHVISGYAARVGERLRTVRKLKHLSLQAVEASSRKEFKASVLGAYERGDRAIGVLRLQRLARFYNVPVDHLLPRDTTDEPHESNPTSEVTVGLAALDALDAPESGLLRRYVGMIQVQRQDFSSPVLTLREEDLNVIALMLETTPVALVRRLAELGLLS